MRLTDLHPRFIGSGGEGVRQRTDRPCAACAGAGCSDCHQSGKEYEPAPRREGIGLMLDCPCGNLDEGHSLFVPFRNPLDDGPCQYAVSWQRTGATFDTLTLTPSILRTRSKGGCGWHGFITNGDVTGQVEES